MPTLQPTRVVVVGAGAFGRNHLRVWREIESSGAGVRLIAAIEPDPASASLISTEFQIPVYQSIDEYLFSETPAAAASVAVPTQHHAAVASRLLASGMDVLLEKPIAASLEDANSIIDIASRNNRVLQIGHLERFNPAVQAVIPIVRRPLFFEIHRMSVFTPRSLDVDVILDLMIHDLDLVLNFVQAPVRELHAVGLPVLSPHIDIANVHLEFASGCVANLTASRVSTEKIRKMRFFQPHQYVSIDYARQDVLCVDVLAGKPEQGNALSELVSADGLPLGSQELRHPTPDFAMRKLQVSPGEPLQLELLAFLHAVQTRSRPVVTGEDGLASLALALDILSAIESHQKRTGLQSSST